MTEGEMVILRAIADSSDIKPVNDSENAKGVVSGMKIISGQLNRYLDSKEVTQ